MQNRDKIKALSETQPSQFRSVPLCKQGLVGFKPEPETVVLQDDSPQKKRPKTPANDTLNPQCSTILKELMKHPTLDAAGFSTNSNKAGRATMLKSRFADTISRAQQKMKVLKDDPMKMKQEKQILEKRAQLQDKEKTEAANAELKEQRERAINSDLTTSSTVVAHSAMLAQDTIKTVVVNSVKNVSPMKIHNEKKRYLEKRQLEENAKTSGSSSAATKMKAKIELKKKR